MPNQLRLSLFALVLLMITKTAFGQRIPPPPVSGSTTISQYVLFADGAHRGMNDSLRYGVEISDFTQITRGTRDSTFIGSNFRVGIGAFNAVVANIYSGNRVNIVTDNTIGGNIVARNDAFVNFNVVNIGGAQNRIGSYDPFSNLGLTPNGGIVQARGNVAAAISDTIQGPVYIQNPYTYTGPLTSYGPTRFLDTLPLPTLPSLPFQTTFSPFGTRDVGIGDSIAPGTYRDMILAGNGTINLVQPGIYVFRSIKTFGKNNINFTIPADSKENYQIYVHEDVDLGPTQVTVNNLGPDGNDNFPLAARIYMEVHGNGSTVPGGYAFHIKDTSRGPEISSFWAGTVYATNGSIAIGTVGTIEGYQTILHGAFWSKTKILIGDNVKINFQPLSFTPVVIDPYYPAPPGGKVPNKIGSELTSLTQYQDIITTVPDNVIFRIEESTQKVWIEVIATSLNYAGLYTFLVSNGFDSVSSSPNRLVLTGKYPIAKLPLLNSRDDVDYVRPLFEPINNSGQVSSQGDVTMKANLVRSQWGIEGNGVTVGVFSDSYNSKGEAPHDVQEGDLPTDVQVIRDFSDPRIDEGRAMAQIIHDVAPNAKLLFRSGIISPLDFALSIKELALPPYNSNVLVDDITYITEPFLKDGLIAQAVNDVVTTNNVTYITSAGNFGSRSFEATFTPSAGAILPDGISGTAHNFGDGIKQLLHLKRGIYTIVLQWDDNFYSLGGNPGAAVDLDIYLLKPDGSYFGFNRNNLTADPFEVLPFNVNEDTDAELLIVNATGATNVKFKFILFRGDGAIEGYPGSSTIVGQANAEGAISVGAMLYDNVNNIVPDYPSVASFSSRGGTAVNGTVRSKPNIVAPNGVNTTVTISTDPITNIDADPFPNFFGTSAAAPHAAGVAALLIEGKKKFNLQPTITPAEVQDLLQTTALDLHEPGFDFKSGYGAIRADEAMLTMANARPVISSLIPPPGLTPTNTVDFTLRVKGKYLNAQTKVYLRGAEISTSFVNNEEVSATVSGPISDDPPIQLYNPPKSPSGLDGGLSEALFLFSTRKNVTVRADNKTKKFGEPLPTTFTASVTIDGVPLSNTTETLASLKLDGTNIRYSTSATVTSNVANYSITPFRNTPLDPSNPVDAELLTKYNFLFLPGTLTVQKLPLKITPRKQTVTYGEYVGGVTYDFDFGGATVDNTIVENLKASYKKYLADNALVVVNGLSTAAGAPTVLKNMSTLASFQSVSNARKYLLQNGRLVPVTAAVSFDQVQNQRFLVDVSALSLAKYDNDSAHIQLVNTPPENKLRGLISARAVSLGTGQASLPNGSLQAVVNGPLMAMVNGSLQAIVNGPLQALVNGTWQPAQDILVHNGTLMAMVNGTWVPATNAQLMAVVNGTAMTVELSMQNGTLQAVVNGTLMAMVNGTLQAVVNGTLIAVVNGQLMAAVNGQMMPVINGSLMAMVNGSLQALVNGSLMAVVNGELVAIDYAFIQNGTLMAVVNGTLQAVVNGPLMAMVNGTLMASVNGTLMAVVNGQVTFAVLVNGTLMAVVNGSLQPMVNGTLMAVVNGILQEVDSYTITNGTLQAVVNGQTYTLTNGSLQALVNGSLQAVVNNLGGISPTNNTNTAIVMDGNDLQVQGGALGGVFSVNMITGLNAGVQKLIPGAFFDPNVDVTYGMGEVVILPAPLTVDADWKYLNEGAPTPPQSFFTSTIKGLAYNDKPDLVTGITYSLLPAYTGTAGIHIIQPGSNTLYLPNYSPILFDTGRLYVNPFGSGAKKLIVKAECVRALTPAEVAQYGYQYMAFFTYNNRNASPVYIPRGADNFISIENGGQFSNTLPEVFEPGLHEVYILFSGHKMYWEVRSLESGHKTAVRSETNANSQKCQGGFTTSRQPSATEIESDKAIPLASVYPNPAHDRVRLSSPEKMVWEKGLAVVDASGRIFTGMPVKQVNENTVEMTVSGLAPGIYHVQVKTAQGFRTLRFTKL